ncbi:molybdopterin biosynthesis protein [Mycoplasmatota bacterium zrk1]
MKRNIYLNSIDLDELKMIIDDLVSTHKFSYEEINVSESLGRITYEEVIARLSSPFYNASAMDGIAVKSKDTLLASETNMVKINDYVEVNTGNPIPDNYDAVIMIEDIIDIDGEVNIIKSASSFQHIRPIGEDVVEGEMIIPRNHKIRPVDISAMIAGGLTKINVIKKPVVSIMPTGSEIINDAKEIEVGKIIDSNSHFLANTIRDLGCEALVNPVVKDNYEELKNNILKMCEKSDLLIIGAGSSAGTKDYSKAIVEDLGEVLIHGISIKPGKPTIIGKIGDVIVVGLPGYPVSTFISFEVVVKEILMKFLKQASSVNTVKAILSKKVYSSLKHHEYVRVKLGYVNGDLVCTPLNRGAGVTMSLVKADGIMVIPKDYEGFERGEIVDIKLFKTLNEVNNTLVSIGSHDILVDYIDDFMSRDKFRLSSTHVGSFGGVLAIKNNECHIAPIHILKEGIYNDVISKYELDAVLVQGVLRNQGIMVKKGNPKNINSINDLVNDIKFVNRQRGSGTRILLDHLLSEKGIDPKLIDGYSYELTTHMTIASAIADGKADAGMGIESVAHMKGLDFIKVAEEKYDFLVKKSILGSKIFSKFIEVLRSEEFSNKLIKIGGYIVKDAGKIVGEVDEGQV